jgi:ubiquinone/menaquinone biosynthesis C-methylase UbiE
VIGGIFSDRSAYHYLPRSVGSFYKPEELREALRTAGLRPAEDVSFMFGSCRIFKAIKSSLRS